MKSYATTLFRESEIDLLERATKLVAKIPEDGVGSLDASPLIRCHELARAVGRVLDLPVVDGKYGPIDHSWLEIPRELPSGRVVPYHLLDVYAIAALPQVQLLDVMTWSLKNRAELYCGGPERSDIDEAFVTRLVEIMTGAAPVARAEGAMVAPCP